MDVDDIQICDAIARIDETEQKLLFCLNKYWGYNSFKIGQLEVCKNILNGKRDCFVSMATGSGKSLMFQLPAVTLREFGTPCISLVISPLLSLIEDQVSALLSMGIPACSLASPAMERMVMDGNAVIVYTTPEKLQMWKHNLNVLHHKIPIISVAIDESHCVSEWGHDFRHEYRLLNVIRETLGVDVPIIALTASATPTVEDDIIQHLRLQNVLKVKSGLNRPNLKYIVNKRNSMEDVVEVLAGYRRKQLRDIAKMQQIPVSQVNADAVPFATTLIYVNSKKLCEEVALYLVESSMLSGIQVAFYHADMQLEERHSVHRAFLDNTVQVIVSTTAFGMGINKSDVRLVIHYGLALSAEGYYQQTGRAGRDHLPSYCYMLWCPNDVNVNYHLMKDRPGGKRSIDYMKDYARGRWPCRRTAILQYFGENTDDYNDLNHILTETCCDLCDQQVQELRLAELQQQQELQKDEQVHDNYNILSATTSVTNSIATNTNSNAIEISHEIYMLISTIAECGGYYGLTAPVNILLGRNDKSTQRMAGYADKRFYAQGKMHSADWWKALARDLAMDNNSSTRGNSSISNHNGHYNNQVSDNTASNQSNRMDKVSLHLLDMSTRVRADGFSYQSYQISDLGRLYLAGHGLTPHENNNSGNQAQLSWIQKPFQLSMHHIPADRIALSSEFLRHHKLFQRAQQRQQQAVSHHHPNISSSNVVTNQVELAATSRYASCLLSRTNSDTKQKIMYDREDIGSGDEDWLDADFNAKSNTASSSKENHNTRSNCDSMNISDVHVAKRSKFDNNETATVNHASRRIFAEDVEVEQAQDSSRYDTFDEIPKHSLVAVTTPSFTAATTNNHKDSNSLHSYKNIDSNSHSSSGASINAATATWPVALIECPERFTAHLLQLRQDILDNSDNLLKLPTVFPHRIISKEEIAAVTAFCCDQDSTIVDQFLFYEPVSMQCSTAIHARLKTWYVYLVEHVLQWDELLLLVDESKDNNDINNYKNRWDLLQNMKRQFLARFFHVLFHAVYPAAPPTALPTADNMHFTINGTTNKNNNFHNANNENRFTKTTHTISSTNETAAAATTTAATAVPFLYNPDHDLLSTTNSTNTVNASSRSWNSSYGRSAEYTAKVAEKAYASMFKPPERVKKGSSGGLYRPNYQAVAAPAAAAAAAAVIVDKKQNNNIVADTNRDVLVRKNTDEIETDVGESDDNDDHSDDRGRKTPNLVSSSTNGINNSSSSSSSNRNSNGISSSNSIRLVKPAEVVHHQQEKEEEGEEEEDDDKDIFGFDDDVDAVHDSSNNNEHTKIIVAKRVASLVPKEEAEGTEQAEEVDTDYDIEDDNNDDDSKLVDLNDVTVILDYNRPSQPSPVPTNSTTTTATTNNSMHHSSTKNVAAYIALAEQLCHNDHMHVAAHTNTRDDGGEGEEEEGEKRGGHENVAHESITKNDHENSTSNSDNHEPFRYTMSAGIKAMRRKSAGIAGSLGKRMRSIP